MNTPMMRALTNAFGIAQACLGVFGFYGVYQYLVEPAGNNSRYQFLFIPALCCIYSLPLLIISALLYRKCKDDFSAVERWAFNIGCLLPFAALGVAIFQ